MNKWLYVTGCAILTAVFVLAPWITKDYAEETVSGQFSSKWQGVMDGCGVKGSYRTFFGYAVEIEYACGLLPSDSPEYHRTEELYVTFIGTIHGLPIS